MNVNINTASNWIQNGEDNNQYGMQMLTNGGMLLRGKGVNSINGVNFIDFHYTADHKLNTIGALRGNSNFTFAYAVEPDPLVSLRYISSADNINWQRSALETGRSLIWRGLPATYAEKGSIVTMPELFKVETNGNVTFASVNAAGGGSDGVLWANSFGRLQKFSSGVPQNLINRTNLDADLLDGQHGGYYYSPSNLPAGDGNGILSGGDQIIPLNTHARWYTYATAPAGSGNLKFGHLSLGIYENEFEALDELGVGVKLYNDIGTNGESQEAGLKISSLATFGDIKLTADELVMNTTGVDKKLNWSGSLLRYFFGPDTDDQYQVFPNARPSTSSVQVTEPDGTTAWNQYTKTYTTSPSGDITLTNTSTITLPDLAITGILAGNYQVEIMIPWNDLGVDDADADVRYSFLVTGADNDDSGYAIGSPLNIEYIKLLWSDFVNVNNSAPSADNMVILSGYLVVPTLATFSVRAACLTSGENILVKKGGYLKLTKTN
jgi:hypothetical protein